jgi:hypothetical protein
VSTIPTDKPSINVTSLIGLLHRYRPFVLIDLRTRFPSVADLLTPGKMLGQDAHGMDAVPTDVLEALARESLVTLRKNEVQAALDLDAKLRQARRLRLVGNLTGGGAAAGVIGAASVGQYLATLISSVIVVISSALSLMAEQMEGLIGGGENRHVLRHRVAEIMLTTIELEGEMKLLRYDPAPREACLAIVRRMNATAAELHRIEFELARHRTSQ